MAFVFGVMSASIFDGSRLNVCGSMSAKTGTAPRRAAASAVATNVKADVITSSPGPMPSAMKAT